jgi:hypothetical protein
MRPELKKLVPTSCKDLWAWHHVLGFVRHDYVIKSRIPKKKKKERPGPSVTAAEWALHVMIMWALLLAP